ncbi:MAG: acyltransferase [Bacteroidales bacterium]|nr:acyltransferase [Bacteroidales bacterium]
MKEHNHIIQLDGLRFFAVLMVMFAHWAQWQIHNPIISSFPFVHGVTLFFVLSGYLITRILITNNDKYSNANREKGTLIKNFYIRRFLRIFPIYYLLIFAFFFIDYKNTRELFPWLVTYTSNIYQSINNVYIGDFNHFWSLAVEEQFYLFWPWLILFAKPKHLLKIIVGSIVIAIISKFFMHFYVGNWMANTYSTISCMHALGLGSLIAYLSVYKSDLLKKLSKPVFVYGSAAIYLISFYFMYKFDLSWHKAILDEFLFAVLAMFIIIRASGNHFSFISKKVLENKFIVYSGKISYGLYVYHLFTPALFYYFAPKIGLSINNKYTLFIAFYLLTFIIAHFSWILIEKPINSLKKRFPYFENISEKTNESKDKLVA